MPNKSKQVKEKANEYQHEKAIKRMKVEWNTKLLKELSDITGIGISDLKDNIIQLSEVIGYKLPSKKEKKKK